MQITGVTWGPDRSLAMVGRPRTVGGAEGDGAPAPAPPVPGSQECSTCKNRTYTDGSSDATVSLQSPTRVSPEEAYATVRNHEQQHVVHEQVRARESGLRVVSQNVAIHSAICPECGRSYVSGGVTTTVTKPEGGSAGYARGGGMRVGGGGTLIDRRV